MEYYYYSDTLLAAEHAQVARLRPGELMRKAAYFTAHTATGMLRQHTGHITGTRVLLLVGPGGNGADALLCGSFLTRRGVSVEAFLVNQTALTEAYPHIVAEYRLFGGRFISTVTKAYDLIIDGISGLRSRRPLAPTVNTLITEMPAPILAIDIPTGIDPDTGQPLGAHITAEATVTFGARKRAHLLGAHYCGRIELLPFSADYTASLSGGITSVSATDLVNWPTPSESDNKYSTGVVGVVAGSQQYPGAALLAVGGAVNATSGMVRYAGSASANVVSHWPEVVASDDIAHTGRVNSWVVGPGLGANTTAIAAVCENIIHRKADTAAPVLIDADAITFMANQPELVSELTKDRVVVFTPHHGEFSRLARLSSLNGISTADLDAASSHTRVEVSTVLARELNAIVLLKGKQTVIAHPDGRVMLSVAPSSWAATPGSGDVLSGIIGSLLATNLAPFFACGLGAKAHGLAAHYAACDSVDDASLTPAGAPIHAGQIIAALPAVIRSARSGFKLNYA